MRLVKTVKNSKGKLKFICRDCTDEEYIDDLWEIYEGLRVTPIIYNALTGEEKKLEPFTLTRKK